MEKEFDFNSIGKRTPFRTPEGFFERMQAETLSRVAEEKRKKKLYRLKWGVSVALAAAAMVCGIIFFPSTKPEAVEPHYQTEWVAQLTDDMDVMDAYLQLRCDPVQTGCGSKRTELQNGRIRKGCCRRQTSFPYLSGNGYFPLLRLS